jgi:hypothetical protein
MRFTRYSRRSFSAGLAAKYLAGIWIGGKRV